MRVNSYQRTRNYIFYTTIFRPFIANLHGLAVQQDPENHIRIHSLAK